MFMDMSPESIQKMMLTPKMLLSMHVLQLNITDLRIFMRAELEENPLLEEETQNESLDKVESRLNEDISRYVNADTNDDNYLSINDENFSVNEEKKRYLESLITKKESLYEHLHWQLQVLAGNDVEKRIGEFIIGNLDENGFLNMELEKMRELINIDIERFKRTLRLVRSFDPSGVGARSTKESLLIQLMSSGKGDTHLYKIVYSHLEDLEKGLYQKIANALSISIKEVEIAKKRLSYFNPKPGQAFGAGEYSSIIEPDVFLDKNNGAYSVEVDEHDLPRLTINRYYKSILRDKHAPEQTKEYIKKKLLNAVWLIDAFNQRRKTIARVCEYLVDVQKDFLRRGDSAIKPLILKEVATALSISEATVSRVVSNKYAQIVNRLIALKRFFAGKIKTADGKFVSDRVIKQEIQDIIETEGAFKPLSDEAITAIINKKGIKVSRRTVAKYREDLGILSSYLRRK